MTDRQDGEQEEVVDRRRPPFCYQTHEALDLIRESFDGAKRPVAIAVYVVFTETANRHGGSTARSGFQAARVEIAERVGVSVDTLDRYVAKLVEIGLLSVERRKIGSVNLPNVWVLEEPVGAPPSRTGAATPSRTGAALRARSSSEAKKQTKEKSLTAQTAEVARESAYPLNASISTTMEVPPPCRVEGRDLPLDALAEVCALTPGDPAYGGAIVALKGRKPTKGGVTPTDGIYDVAWQEVTTQLPLEAVYQLRNDPEKWQQMLAEIIRYKARLYHARMRGAILTPKALRDWWLRLEMFDQITGTVTLDDFANMFRTAS